MWRLQAYGGVFLLLLYGYLSKYNIIEFRRMSSEYYWMSLVAGAFLFIMILYIEWDLYRKGYKSEIDSKKLNYKKIILSTLGLVYLIAHLFHLPYTNDIGMVIAIGVIWYVNRDISVFKQSENTNDKNIKESTIKKPTK